MSDLTRWQEQNQEYLAAALAWLRLRLWRQIQQSEPAHISLQDGQSQPNRLFSRTQTAPDTSSEQVSGAKLSEAAEVMEHAGAADPPPSLILLSQQFGLSLFEQCILLVCAAMELDTRIALLCARAQGDANRPYPTFALALSLFDEPAWDALSPERPLRHWRLIEINQPAAQPLTTSPLRADERIVSYLKGHNYLDDRLLPLLISLETGKNLIELPPSQHAAADTIIRYLKQSAETRYLPCIQLLGADVVSKQAVACYAAWAFGRRLYRLPTSLLPTQVADLETFNRLWERESILLPVALYLDTLSTAQTAPNEHYTDVVNRLLARLGGLIFLDTRDPLPSLNRDCLLVDIARPTPVEQEMIWAEALDGVSEDSPALLAGQFNLDQETIQRIARSVLADPAQNGSTLYDQLWDTCLSNTRPLLGTLAQRLEPKATWESIVLPAEEMSLLQQIAEQVRRRNTVYEKWGFHRVMNRGLGINALFAGESGTGKTMAAEVIANELRLDLYRIDLSAVVSKYIGDTEKNIRLIFDENQYGGAILFFDEADALFGKRSEVKDSHDRYANIEIGYLLQRIELYSGLAILATNMKSALDNAFLRRLRFIVNFPFPGPAERKLIWQKAFPPEVPIQQGLEFDNLARLNLTGGSIHNIALNAAFRAAGCNPPIVTLSLILGAARAELRKLERPINETDFLVAAADKRAI